MIRVFRNWWNWISGVALILLCLAVLNVERLFTLPAWANSMAMCGDQPYNPSFQGCCNGQIYDLASQGCCGSDSNTQLFDLSSHGCCGDELYDLSSEGCCGGLTY